MSDDNWYQSDTHNPYSGGSSNQFRSAHYAQKTSALAILSVLSGVLSFPMMCLCFLSIPFSVFAIVCGHMSRGVVRNSNGEYGGLEMATVGMVMGYASLLIMGSFMLVGLTAQQNVPPIAVPAPAPTAPSQNDEPSVAEGTVLLRLAEGQLRSGTDAALGVSTTNGDAAALARHYIETLHVLDKTHFSESNEAAVATPRAYRVFVQLNAESIAFLVDVPELSRFTPEAREILRERSWLIAQRSVDDILPEGKELAVAIYSNGATEYIMTGVTARNGPSDAGLKNSEATATELAVFFLLDKRPAKSMPDEEPVDSQIKPKEAPAEI